jgi:small neutral amino acid transporter SnatA (MarC family)
MDNLLFIKEIIFEYWYIFILLLPLSILWYSTKSEAFDESITWVFSTLLGGLFLPIFIIFMTQFFSGAYSIDNTSNLSLKRDIDSIFVGGGILLFSVAIVMAVLTDFYLYNRQQKKNQMADKIPRWWILFAFAVFPITIMLVSSTFLATCFNKDVQDFNENCLDINTLIAVQMVILTLSLLYAFILKNLLSKREICHQEDKNKSSNFEGN